MAHAASSPVLPPAFSRLVTKLEREQRGLGYAQAPYHGNCRQRHPEQRMHPQRRRSAEHTSELQSLMRISYAVFCLKKNNHIPNTTHTKSNPYPTNTHTQRQTDLYHSPP